MGSKVTIPPLGNPEGSSFVTKLNEALTTLADEFDKAVYKDGTQALEGDLDASSRRIYNLPAPGSPNEPLRAGDVFPDGDVVTPLAIGLGNVDNVADANKPVSGPQAAALALKGDSHYTPAWGSSRLVTDKQKDLPHLYDIITNEANRNSSYDATAALNSALASGQQFVLPKSEVRFSGTLNATVDGAGFIGQGFGSRLVHTSATGDMFLLGNGSTQISGLKFSNFRLWSTVNKTAGAMFNGRYVSDARFENVYAGSLHDYVAAGNVNRMFDGYIFNRFAEVTVYGGQGVAKSNLIRMNGNLDNSFGVELEIDGNWRGLYAAKGIIQGGATGGVYYNRADLSNCGEGVVIDQSLMNTYNREAFFSNDFTVDSCTGNGVVIDQPAIASAQFLFNHTWLAGNGGHGLWIKNANDARIVGNIHAYKNTGDGIRYSDANAYLVVPSAARFDINQGFAINPTVASARIELGNPSFLANTSGNFNTAFNQFVSKQIATQQFNVAPTAGWANDFTNNSVIIPNGGNASLAPGSGLVQVSSTANGHTAVYLVSGAVVVLLGTTGASWVAPTSSPAAGQSSIAWDGVSAYKIYNNLGATNTFSVGLIKTRIGA